VSKHIGTVGLPADDKKRLQLSYKKARDEFHDANDACFLGGICCDGLVKMKWYPLPSTLYPLPSTPVRLTRHHVETTRKNETV
jgi:hypothetical protein